MMTQRTPARSRHLARAVGLQVLLLLGTALIVELILRAVDLRELRDGYGVGAAAIHRYDPELGWLPVPNASATYHGSRTIAVRSNSIGLRDVEHDRSARPTVLFLGDSFTWGYDVGQNERFTELLRDRLPGTRIVNAGVVGYGTDQEYLLLARLWPTFEPTIVVLIFCADNDRQDNATNVSSPGYYKPYLEQAADGNWRIAGQPVPKSRHAYFTDSAVVKHSWLARLAVTGYVYLRYPRITMPDPTERLVDVMRRFAESRGGTFVVGLQNRDAQTSCARKDFAMRRSRMRKPTRPTPAIGRQKVTGWLRRGSRRC